MDADTDIVIVGGGPVGAALALALRDSGLRLTVLEARTVDGGGARDPRPIALSHGSRLLLERLGVWADISATPINHIHVSQRGGFGRMAMSAADANVPHLGYVIDYHHLFSALAGAAQRAGCDYREAARATALTRDGDVSRFDYTRDGAAAALTARLVVVADGGDIAGLAPPKIVDYAQHALTARVSTTLPHKNVAYERFTPDGPLALLPYSDRGDRGDRGDQVNQGNAMALVWTLAPARAEALKDADDKTFLDALRVSFGARLGEFTSVTQRACYPLTLRYSTNTNPPGVIAIGNAAQTLHPVAGQGFNLGLRDAWELAQMLCRLSPQALTNPETIHETTATLRDFHASRRIDRGATIAATHGLVRLFSNDFLPISAARGVGMTALGCVAPLRNFAVRRMIFGARG